MFIPAYYGELQAIKLIYIEIYKHLFIVDESSFNNTLDLS